MQTDENRLRYLSADCVEILAEGKLSDTLLLGDNDRPLGKLDGVVIDPLERRVRFYVIKSDGWFRSHRYLMPAAAVQVETDRHALHVLNGTDPDSLREVEADAFPRYSVEDLIEVMAAPFAA
jgi:hypothetical protein